LLYAIFNYIILIYSDINSIKIQPLIKACRINQWTKNSIVFLAPFFGFSFELSILISSIKAFLSFCLISSSIYLINDCIDKNKDIKHPIKRYRPIASGLISKFSAIIFSLILLVISLTIGASLNNYIIALIILYFLIQLMYCLFLKEIPLIEFFCIASGFVIRSIAGGIATGAFISYWFLLSVGMLSLFLALEKRKAEILNMQITKIITRNVLKSYSLSLINKLESVLTSCTVMTYSLWCFGPQVGGATSPLMIITIPLVILGIFRYQMLSEISQNSKDEKYKISLLESPENVLIKDKPIQIVVSTWLLITIYIGFLT